MRRPEEISNSNSNNPFALNLAPYQAGKEMAEMQKKIAVEQFKMGNYLSREAVRVATGNVNTFLDIQRITVDGFANRWMDSINIATPNHQESVRATDAVRIDSSNPNYEKIAGKIKKLKPGGSLKFKKKLGKDDLEYEFFPFGLPVPDDHDLPKKPVHTNDPKTGALSIRWVPDNIEGYKNAYKKNRYGYRDSHTNPAVEDIVKVGLTLTKEEDRLRANGMMVSQAPEAKEVYNLNQALQLTRPNDSILIVRQDGQPIGVWEAVAMGNDPRHREFAVIFKPTVRGNGIASESFNNFFEILSAAELCDGITGYLHNDNEPIKNFFHKQQERVKEGKTTFSEMSIKRDPEDAQTILVEAKLKPKDQSKSPTLIFFNYSALSKRSFWH